MTRRKDKSLMVNRLPEPIITYITEAVTCYEHAES